VAIAAVRTRAVPAHAHLHAVGVAGAVGRTWVAARAREFALPVLGTLAHRPWTVAIAAVRTRAVPAHAHPVVAGAVGAVGRM
jgi:hypothetical protein